MVSIYSAATCEQADLQPMETENILIEQRREHRHRLYSTPDVAFYNLGRLYRGYMSDLSSGGARLVLPIDTPDGIPELYRGRKMECYLLNRYGSSKCRGTIQWLLFGGIILQWGISFIELSVEQDDPLQKSINEARRSFNYPPITGSAVC